MKIVCSLRPLIALRRRLGPTSVVGRQLTSPSALSATASFSIRNYPDPACAASTCFRTSDSQVQRIFLLQAVVHHNLLRRERAPARSNGSPVPLTKLRQRGINIDSTHFNYYEYTVIMDLNGQKVAIPYAVIADRCKHETIVAPGPLKYPFAPPSRDDAPLYRAAAARIPQLPGRSSRQAGARWVEHSHSSHRSFFLSLFINSAPAATPMTTVGKLRVKN